MKTDLVLLWKAGTNPQSFQPLKLAKNLAGEHSQEKLLAVIVAQLD